MPVSNEQMMARARIRRDGAGAGDAPTTDLADHALKEGERAASSIASIA